MLLWAGFFILFGVDARCPTLACSPFLPCLTLIGLNYLFSLIFSCRPCFVSTGRFCVKGGPVSRPHSGIGTGVNSGFISMAFADESTCVDEFFSHDNSNPYPNMLYAFSNIYTCWTGQYASAYIW
jgi:hypothetical protein